MSATGLTTAALQNVVANAFAGAALYFTAFKALTLGSGVSAGAPSFSVDLSVQAGDILVFEVGLPAFEQVTVLSVTGSGPYTVVPVTSLVNAHLTGARIGHVPLNSTTVHEVSSVTRVAANWGSPSPAGTVTSNPAALTIPSGNVVGSIGAYSAITSGTYYDATAINALDFTSVGGTYIAPWVEVFS